MLSKDGACRSFDEDGMGYVRSETIAAIYLQSTESAKRIYATVIHSKISSDGYKDLG